MGAGEVTGMKQTRTRALFATFFKIGAFTFGGGYAMVALLEHEFVEEKQWVTREEFLDMVAIAESTPGPMAVNSATYIGYKLEWVPGAAASTLAVCLPSFAVIYAISLFFDQFLQLSVVSSAFRGIQVCVVYLVLSAGLKMLKNLKKDAFSRTVLAAVLLALSYRRGGLGLAIPLGAALLVLNPISTALCFQYTDVYLLTLVFGILLLWRRTDEQKFGCLLYLWLGIGLGFFDFLTYPVASLGILLAIELTVSTSGLWKKIQAMLLNSTAWALGYGGMWAGKWVVASVFTDQNVILDALRNISGRTSSTAGEETVDIFSVLWRNAQTYVNVQTLFLLLVLGALLGYLVTVKKFRLRLSASTLVPLVLCALYPVVWYAVLRNHSMIHAYMTHRDLAVTVMALGCAIGGSLEQGKT